MDTKNEAASPQGADRNTLSKKLYKVTKFFSQKIELDLITFALFVIWVITLIAAIL